MDFEEKRQVMIKEGEGSISHMYLDTRGLVTVAVGQLLRSAEAAQQLGFVRRDSGQPASHLEIAQDFGSVARQPAGRVASFYKEFTKLDLPGPAIDSLLDERIRNFEAGLRADFPDYEEYSDNVKLGLMDMAFNLGNAGLVNKFPSFTKAVRGREWQACAKECERRGVGGHRNAMIRRLFEGEVA